MGMLGRVLAGGIAQAGAGVSESVDTSMKMQYSERLEQARALREENLARWKDQQDDRRAGEERDWKSQNTLSGHRNKEGRELTMQEYNEAVKSGNTEGITSAKAEDLETRLTAERERSDRKIETSQAITEIRLQAMKDMNDARIDAMRERGSGTTKGETQDISALDKAMKLLDPYLPGGERSGSPVPAATLEAINQNRKIAGLAPLAEQVTPGKKGETHFFGDDEPDTPETYDYLPATGMIGKQPDAGGAGYGARQDGTQKGKGYFGELARPDGGFSTELSIGVNLDGKEVEIPALVPTLSQEEKDFLLEGNKPTQEIVNKAVKHARERMKQGKSPFAGEGEQSKVEQPVEQSPTKQDKPAEKGFAPGKKILQKGVVFVVGDDGVPRPEGKAEKPEEKPRNRFAPTEEPKKESSSMMDKNKESIGGLLGGVSQAVSEKHRKSQIEIKQNIIAELERKQAKNGKLSATEEDRLQKAKQELAQLEGK